MDSGISLSLKSKQMIRTTVQFMNDGYAVRAVFTCLTVERDWFWFWFWFCYALWLASVFNLVLVLRQSSENRSKSMVDKRCIC